MSNSLFHKRTQLILNGLLKEKRFANSYLFHGPNGSFKDYAAQSFAQSIHQGKQDLSLSEFQPKTPLSNVTDLFQFKSEKSITVEHIRNLQETIKYGPHEKNKLIVIIYNCETMTIAAANAFLKSLEEPPENVVFILLTQSKSAVLPTISSRSQCIDFPILESKSILNYFSQDMSSFSTGLGETIMPSLLESYLYNDYTIEKPLDNIESILKLPHEHISIIAEQLNKEKDMLPLILENWCKQLISFSKKEKVNQLRIIESFFHAKHYNLNLKLALESLLIKLINSAQFN